MYNGSGHEIRALNLYVIRFYAKMAFSHMYRASLSISLGVSQSPLANLGKSVCLKGKINAESART